METLRWNLAKTGIAIRRAGGPSSTPPAHVQLACDHIVAMRIVGIAERIQHPREGQEEEDSPTKHRVGALKPPRRQADRSLDAKG